MPHLSPMSWILAILLFWLSTSILTSTFWWTEQHIFNSKTSHSALFTQSSWKW